MQFAASRSQHFTAKIANNTATTKFFVVRLNSLPPASFSIFGGPNGYQVSVSSEGKLDVAVTNVTWIIYGTGAHTLTANTWYVLAMTSNGSNSTTTYVNGIKDATSTAAIQSPPQPLPPWGRTTRVANISTATSRKRSTTTVFSTKPR